MFSHENLMFGKQTIMKTFEKNDYVRKPTLSMTNNWIHVNWNKKGFSYKYSGIFLLIGNFWRRTAVHCEHLWVFSKWRQGFRRKSVSRFNCRCLWKRCCGLLQVKFHQWTFLFVDLDLAFKLHFRNLFSTYYRSKPVVRVKSKVSFPYASNKQINLDEKACTLRDRTAVTCTQLAICMEYDGVGADDVIGK